MPPVLSLGRTRFLCGRAAPGATRGAHARYFFTNEQPPWSNGRKASLAGMVWTSL